MPTIIIETPIAAPREVCFDLARDVGVHCATSEVSGERAVAPGKTSGLLEVGDQVTFEGRHLGVKQRLTAQITEMERPLRFVDVQIRGAFSSLKHIHEFETTSAGTLMRDTITWRSPLGLLGCLADALVVTRHMEWFVRTKQLALKAHAEELARAN